MNKSSQPPLRERILVSKLLDVDTLANARSTVGDDEERLGDYLVEEGLLSSYQLRQLRNGAKKFHVDKYVIVDYIGRGGNAIVFKARHTLLPQRYVALKTFDSRDLHHDKESLARFRREIDIVARMDHPNVVRAYDVLRTRRQVFLVLEYIEGKDLSSLVKQRGPLPINEAVDYAIQAARGLAYAHRCGVVHRDLKPANLLLTREGVVKLSDLGLARLVAQADAELTMKGQCLGTPEFMAPEQAEDARNADTRSDLYSLGGTLFHLLTGELPVRGSSQLQRLQHLLTRPPKPLLESRLEAPPELAAVVDRLRSRNPGDRPACAEEAIALLERFLPSGSPSEDVRNWDGQRKANLVLAVLQGKLGVTSVCDMYQLTPTEFADWQQRFLDGARQALDQSTVDFSCQFNELKGQILRRDDESSSLRQSLLNSSVSCSTP